MRPRAQNLLLETGPPGPDVATFKAALDSLPAHIAILAADGEILWVNEAWRTFARQNGLRAAGFGEGENYLDVCDRASGAAGAEASSMAAGMRAVARGARASYFQEYECSSPTEQRWFQCRVTRFEAPACAAGAAEAARTLLVVSHENISEAIIAQRTIRQRLEQSAHLLRLQTMGELAAALAHELNQPLAALCNLSAGCLRRAAGEPINPEILWALRECNDQALRAGALIRRMRDFARRSGPRTASVHPAELMQAALSLVGPLAREWGVEIEDRIPDSVPAVDVDPILVQQVFVNLIRNAMEAARPADPPRRRVRVEATTDRAGFVHICVSDGGPGLAEGLSLFEPFVTTKPSGLGLGLAVSRSIVENHGGRISAAAGSALGGAAFTFTLPARPEAAFQGAA